MNDPIQRRQRAIDEKAKAQGLGRRLTSEDLPIVDLASDTQFYDSPDAGDPRCLCSRCGKVIPQGQTVIRAVPAGAAYELRYHAECLKLVRVAE